MMEFLGKVKQEIRPDTSVLVEIEIFIKEINKEIKENNIRAVCVAGGSIAKGTFLKGDFDVDLFVRFDYGLKDQDISVILHKILEKFSPEKVHGSRDYFHIRQNNLTYEIVPVLDVKNPEKALNVTDMSPLHVEWVKKRIKKGQEDEIRLAKRFCKSIGAYGAESYIHGFSGHVLDILILHYGSFLNLLKESGKWTPKVVIDIEKHYRVKNDVLFNINQSKLQGPMIVVDPILSSRNASSALSYEKFALFKKKAKEFLKSPSEAYFSEPEIGITYLRARYRKNLFVVSAKSKKGKEDIIGSKILKAYKFIKSELKSAGFEIKKSGWHWNKKQRVLIWLVPKEAVLPGKKIIKGPPMEMTEACKRFREKYRGCFEKSGRIYTEALIEKRNFEENILHIAEKQYFKERVTLIKVERYY